MRIDKLQIQNFKKFVNQTFEFHPHFTLLVGDNGSGKTSVLDALAVAIGIWQKSIQRGGWWRNILPGEIRVDPVLAGDRTTFEPRLPCKISAWGKIGKTDDIEWTREIRKGGSRTTNAGAQRALAIIDNIVTEAEKFIDPLPVLAYYGAGRAWLPTNRRFTGQLTLDQLSRYDAYYHCLDTSIREQDINEWVLFETAAVNENNKERAGFQAVKQAILNCIPDADELKYDTNRKQIVLSINNNAQPFYNLSAGQRMMLALIADIAIKAVTLNSYLLGTEDRDPMEILNKTPGIVLIDELDMHLHPKWQRRIANDLKRTFPAIQFVCTSHSPQVIGEVPKEEIRILEDDLVAIPPRSLGIDSNRILEELMGSPRRDEASEQELTKLFEIIDREDFDAAKIKLEDIGRILGPDDPELTRAKTLIAFLEHTE